MHLKFIRKVKGAQTSLSGAPPGNAAWGLIGCETTGNPTDAPSNLIPFESNTMKRLPSYNSKHQRAEKVVFATLQLVAMALVALVVADGARFSAHQDAIGQALCSNLVGIVKTTKAGNRPVPNLRVNQEQQTAGAPRAVRPTS